MRQEYVLKCELKVHLWPAIEIADVQEHDLLPLRRLAPYLSPRHRSWASRHAINGRLGSFRNHNRRCCMAVFPSVCYTHKKHDEH